MKQDKFAIVVVGAMNPSIHHPFWYRTTDGISEDEMNLALRSGSVVCTPQLAQFKIGALDVLCLPDRWQVQTTETGQFDRVVALALKVFERLTDTPIRGLGLNFQRAEPCNITALDGLMGSALQALPLGFGGDARAPALSKVSVIYPLDDIETPTSISASRRLIVNVEVDRKKELLRVHSNVDHTFRSTRWEHFEWGSILVPAAGVRDVAINMIDRVFRSATQSSGV